MILYMSSSSASRSRSGRMRESHWRLWIAVVIGWTLIGLIFTLNYYLFADHYVAIFRQPPTLPQMLIWELPYWFLWAALSPVVFWLTRHVPLQRGRMLVNSGAHVAACIVLSVLHRAAYLIIGWLLHVAVYRHLSSSISDVFSFLLLFNLQTGFMSYGTVLLVSYVIDYYRRYQNEELKISRLKTDLAEAQLQTAQAQLQSLKMQLQPHFLFNTLNSISTLLDEDVEAADEMLARLGDFLRLTLDNSGAEEVTLQEELELLRCYLEIEQVRFQDRLTVLMEIEPETLEALVPNLILQPIVENAIRHGIVEEVGKGRIEIHSSRSNGMLLLQVRDNGPGLRAEASAGRAGSKRGLGFTLTRERLERLYAARQRFHLDEAAPGGVQVTLEIPFVTPGSNGAQTRATEQ
jgi:two-component system LytT family sensor kinase